MTEPQDEPQERTPKERQDGPLMQFLWDLLPAKFVPGQSGLKSAPFVDALWLTEEFANSPEALASARRAHDQQRERADTAEQKGTRLAQMSLALLALAFVVGGIELRVIQDARGVAQVFALLPVAFAVVCLALAGVESLEIDRVGLYGTYGPEVAEGRNDPLRALVAAEERGRQLAAWTSKAKLDRLLQARAWFSRGLLLLILAGVLSLGLTASQSPEPAPSPVASSSATPSVP